MVYRHLIGKPQSFNEMWFSHKIKAAGVLSYEIGISITETQIVWTSDGFSFGKWPDLKECVLATLETLNGKFKKIKCSVAGSGLN